MPERAIEISANVHWLDSGASNLYLCLDGDEVTLIDAGMPRKERLVLDALAALGHPPQALRRILITHADIDHAGSAAALHAQTGARILASAETAAHLRSGRSPKHLPWIAELFSRFIKYPAVPAQAIDLFQAGKPLPVLGGMQVLATPGHTMDHHSFYNPSSGMLFVGDALNTRNGRLTVTPNRITADETAARQSALALLALSPTCLACGHGRPLQNPTAETIKTLFTQLQEE